jgi:hypothetical protein
MYRMLLMFSIVTSVAIAGCSSISPGSREQSGTQAIVQPQAPVNAAASKRNADLIVANDGAGTVVIRKVEFRPGVSSATVERLGKQAGCSGGAGAGLITEKGPVEVYRMQCENGTSFLAKCELRQCKPMR